MGRHPVASPPWSGGGSGKASGKSRVEAAGWVIKENAYVAGPWRVFDVACCRAAIYSAC